MPSQKITKTFPEDFNMCPGFWYVEIQPGVLHGAVTFLNYRAKLLHLPLLPAQHGLSLSQGSWEAFNAHVLQGQLVLTETPVCRKMADFPCQPSPSVQHMCRDLSSPGKLWFTAPCPSHGNHTAQEIPNENVSPLHQNVSFGTYGSSLASKSVDGAAQVL